MPELHFLRPWWLLALPLGLWLVWMLFRARSAAGAWHKVVDPALQPHVLSEARTAGRRGWAPAAAIAGVVLCTLALAGPAWERVHVPTARDEGALVVALDLSRTMDAADVEPTRLARARLKLHSLLDRRQGGQTALVVFSTHAFTVTPLTTDSRTVASLINALSTDIMPTQGSVPESGLQKAGELLRGAGLMRATVLLITDSAVSERTLAAARTLNREGFTVHVMGVGTEEGAPIASGTQGFVTDAAGRVVIPRLERAGLERLAAAGGGRFAQLRADDSDLDALFPAGGAPALTRDVQEEDEQRAEVWRDIGPWLALVLLPVMALAFRRGWIVVLAVVLVLPAQQAEASFWRSLWQRPDRQGYEAMLEEEPERAARLFRDPEWRAAAQYRAGDHDASAATLERVDGARAHYNRGNALARAGRLLEAVEAYEQALALDPAHLDARYNRDLVEDLLAEQPDLAGTRQGDAGSGPEARDETDAGGRGEAPTEPQDPAGAEDGDSGQDAGAEEDAGAQPDVPAEQDSNAESAGGAEEWPWDRPPDAAAELESGTPPLAEPAQPDAAGEALGGAGAALDPADLDRWAAEQAAEQWLRRVPQDPGGLLRRKFLYQYQRLGLDQDGNRIHEEENPW